jgi:hypothetical protein
MKYEIINKNPYNGKDLIDSERGIIIKDAWTDGYKEIIDEFNIKSIFLNNAKGWKCDSYSFLSELHKLLLIDIIDSHAYGISSIEDQTELRELNLNLPIDNHLNLERLKFLEDCYIVWNKYLNSIFEVRTLKRLYIDELKTKDTHSLSKLAKLEELTIGNSNILSLDFLYSLKENLKGLELLNCRSVVDYTPINSLIKLKRLNIDGFKDIGSIEFIQGLDELEILLLNVGKIDTIRPLQNLKKLKAISFFGSSTYIADGDLQPLTELASLSMLMVVDKKHYTHKLCKPWNWKNYGIPDKLLISK